MKLGSTIKKNPFTGTSYKNVCWVFEFFEVKFWKTKVFVQEKFTEQYCFNLFRWTYGRETVLGICVAAADVVTEDIQEGEKNIA